MFNGEEEETQNESQENYRLVFTLQEWFLCCFQLLACPWNLSSHWPTQTT